jgi:GNAT superfamily N-acetyltransferase
MSSAGRDARAIAVREARDADASAIAQLCAQLGYPTTADAIGRRLAALADPREHVVLVGLRDAVVIGWLHAAITRALEYEPCAEILGLVVDDAARGLGVGAQLVAQAEVWARGCGVPEMRVRSRETRERAHRFYLRCGYEIWKRQVVFRKRLGTAE